LFQFPVRFCVIEIFWEHRKKKFSDNMHNRKFFNQVLYLIFILKVLSIAKSSEIINSLLNVSNQMTLVQLQQVTSGLFSTIANSLIVVKFLISNLFQ